jgi:hypothetical protein
VAGCCEHGNEFLDSIKGGKNDLETKELCKKIVLYSLEFLSLTLWLLKGG